MNLCPPCRADTNRWLDTITPGPHQPYPWEPQPVGRFRIADADNRYARTSIGAQKLRVVRGQLALIKRLCERDHQRCDEAAAS